jgi:hypothetical protein
MRRKAPATVAIISMVPQPPVPLRRTVAAPRRAERPNGTALTIKPAAAVMISTQRRTCITALHGGVTLPRTVDQIGGYARVMGAPGIPITVPSPASPHNHARDTKR